MHRRFVNHLSMLQLVAPVELWSIECTMTVSNSTRIKYHECRTEATKQ